MLVNRKSFIETSRKDGFTNGTVEVTLRGETRRVRAHYWGEPGTLNKSTLIVKDLVDSAGNAAAIQQNQKGSEHFLKNACHRVRGVVDVEAKVFFKEI